MGSVCSCTDDHTAANQASTELQPPRLRHSQAPGIDQLSPGLENCVGPNAVSAVKQKSSIDRLLDSAVASTVDPETTGEDVDAADESACSGDGEPSDGDGAFAKTDLHVAKYGLDVIFRLPDNMVRTVTFERRPLGLKFTKTVPCMVVEVFRDSLAEELGVMPNWEVLSLNGDDLDGMSSASLAKSFRAKTKSLQV
uniref:PDZ domain-containing protein n=1 Tax=Noctiluca scintillans TaxID=2966 RepID=A0A7S0ZM14_NOCSC|mmetsp:Transcript_10656/g.29544  ORF Transcript_10656/g.29544 Transcript_10656/m.29544 type:complete len:196 (+) Transcript_10656:76-663(+)